MRINGVQKQYHSGLTVSEILMRENFEKERVAVELNEEIISKDDYDNTVLNDTDVMEVVSFMGGGSQ